MCCGNLVQEGLIHVWEVEMDISITFLQSQQSICSGVQTPEPDRFGFEFQLSYKDPATKFID